MTVNCNLNPKQKNFADRYLESGNAIRAAIETGYGAKGAQAAGSKLLKNVIICYYIETRQKQSEKNSSI